MRGTSKALGGVGIAAMGITAALGGSSALAAKPAPSAVSISISPNPVLFGKPAGIGGQLAGGTVSGVTVRLQINPYPYSGFRKGPETTTDATGKYFFAQAVGLNTRYLVTARTKGGTATSATVTELVRPRLTLKLGTYSPRRGSRVRFSGSLYPAHDGRLVAVQRRLASGAFRTIARIRLTHVTDGSRSAYSKRLRVYRSGALRAILPAHADHATGFSGQRTVRVR